MSTDTSEPTPMQITVWGPSAAGKTMLLAQLYDHETADAGHGHDRLEDGWEMLPTESSLPFIRAMRSTMASANRFPAATAVGTTERIAYRAVHRPSGRQILIESEDRAGRDYEEHEASAGERLHHASGWILLLDPDRAPADRERELWETLEGLHVAAAGGMKRDPRPVAVCVSKADRLIRTASDLARAEGEPDAFARGLLSATSLRALERFCARFRCFALSAAGVRQRHGTVEPVVFFDQDLTPRICPHGGRPVNLLAPFVWIIEELTTDGAHG